jgi:hypothetical protein
VAGQELAVPAQQVTVTLGTPMAGARTFVPEDGTRLDRSYADPPGRRGLDTVELEVTDQVVLLELLPRRADGAAPRATSPPPDQSQATPTTQAPVVRADGQPAPPTTAPAAAARAAAEGQPAAALDPASRSPLAFTGSTALSMLGASVLLLLVGVAALFASRRRYHHRH